MRYERKYTVNHLDSIQIKEWILSQSGHFREHYPERVINNIYYDTPCLTCYEQNIRDVSNRVKYRIRWYDDFDSFHHPKLELKIKKGNVNYKKINRLPPLKMEDCLTASQSWKKGLNITDLSDLEPTLINHYTRNYFISHTNNIRITLDSSLSFRVAYHSQKLRLSHFNVVELKYDTNQVSLASSLISNIPFRLSKFSKYVIGLQSLNGKGFENWPSL